MPPLLPRRRKPKVATPGRTEAQVMAAVHQACWLMGAEVDRQNTGGMTNASGRYVAFGVAGNSDLCGMTNQSWGPLAGRVVMVECKREFFRPPRPPKPGKPKSDHRARWERQLERLRRTNANGGFGFWTDDLEHCLEVLRLLKAGYTIDIGDDEHVWLTPPRRERG